MCNVLKILILLCLLIAVSCLKSNQLEQKSQSTYCVTEVPFRGEWWHYYERGLSCASGFFWEKAEADFREAIIRRGNEKKSPRTYGRHFLSLPYHDHGYFPHRELGIVLFKQKKIDEAIQELTISYSNFKTARAALYLDRARKKHIQHNHLDYQPPMINITSPKLPLWTNQSSVLIYGVASDDSYIQKIIIKKQSIPIPISKKEILFSKRVSLASGENEISILTKDITGRETKQTLMIHMDRIGPGISIDDPSQSIKIDNNKIHIKCFVFDQSGISKIKINQTIFNYDGETEIKIDSEFPQVNDDNFLYLQAIDIAGNCTSANIDLSKSMAIIDRPGLLADASGAVLANRMLYKPSQVDSSPPEIEILHFHDPLKIYSTVQDEVILEGYIQDDYRVKSVFFNTNRIDFRGRKNYFKFVQSLNKGKNVIIIRGLDSSDNPTRKQITIIKKIPEIKSIEKRWKLKLSNIQTMPQLSDWNEIIVRFLETALFERKRFNLIADKSEIPDCTLKLFVAKTPSFVEFFADLYDRSLKKIIAKVNAHIESDSSEKEFVLSRQIIKSLSDEIELRLTQEVPLISGKISEIDLSNNIITTELGKASLLKPFMELIVYKKQNFEEQNFATIIQVDDYQSMASLNTSATFDIECEVITR
ncbi:conserved hypothetical protein, secreted [Candidatus Magnetomorum sp. HK-1]|nr:conserved hypothetical protein, secreted [Candidatus Magnetomorum sp. HK-1]